MLTLFEINWSLSGTTVRGIEEAVIVAWSEYVLNMKGTATTELIQKCECCFSFTPNKKFMQMDDWPQLTTVQCGLILASCCFLY